MSMTREFKFVDVVVDYGSTYENLVASLNVNGSVGPIIQQAPTWSVVDGPRDNAITTVRVQLYRHDDFASASPIYRQMAILHLRPVIFPEFRAVVCAIAGRHKLACLGTLWDHSRLLCWAGERGHLAFTGHALGKDFVFPALYHVGNWNKR